MGVEQEYEATPAVPEAAPSPQLEAPVPAAPVPMAVGTLVVGHAEDRAEADADRMADSALGNLRRLGVDTHQHGPGCDHVRRSPAPSATPVVGRAGGALDAGTSSAIENRRGSGRPLDGDVRRRMETAFSADFSAVRIHDDAASADLNSAVSARAFTTGKDIFFGAGQYAPDSPGGERVLAHELAHTLQPGSGAHREFDTDVESAEVEAAEVDEVAATPQPSALESHRNKPLPPTPLAALDSHRNKPLPPTPGAPAAPAKKSLFERAKAFVYGDRAEAKKKRDAVNDPAAAKEKHREVAQQGARDANQAYRAKRALEFAAEEESARLAKAQLAGGGDKSYTFRSAGHRELLENLKFATINYHSRVDDIRAANKAKLAKTTGATPLGPDEEGPISEAERNAAYKWAYVDQGWRGKIDLDLLMFRPLYESTDERLASHIRNTRGAEGAVQAQAEANLLASTASGKFLDVEVELVYDDAARRMAASKKTVADDENAKTMAISMAWLVADESLAEKRPKDARIENAAFDQALARYAAKQGPLAAASTMMEDAKAVTAPMSAAGKAEGLVGSGAKQITKHESTQLATDAVGDLTSLLKKLLTTIDSVREGAEAITEANAETNTETVLTATQKTSEASAGLLELSSAATSVAKTFSAADVAAGLAANVIPGINVAAAVMTLVSGVFTLRDSNGNRDTAQKSLFDLRLKTHGTDDIDALVNPMKYMVMMLTKKYEQAIYNVGKAIKDVVLNTLELAGGGLGIPTAAKLVFTVVDVVHKLGHFVHNQVLAYNSEQSRTASIQALEGSAEQQLRHDPSMVMDAIITQAKQTSEPAALSMLSRYGVTPGDVQSKPMIAIRKDVLGQMGVSENPETVYTTVKKGIAAVEDLVSGESWLARRSRERDQLAADRTLMDGKERGFLWHFQMAFKFDSFERSKAQTAAKMKVACAVGPHVVGYNATMKEKFDFAEAVSKLPLKSLIRAEEQEETAREWKLFLQGVIEDRMKAMLEKHRTKPLPPLPKPAGLDKLSRAANKPLPATPVGKADLPKRPAMPLPPRPAP